MDSERLIPIRLDPKHAWYFVRRDIVDAYGREMESMNLAIWDAEDDPKKSIAW